MTQVPRSASGSAHSNSSDFLPYGRHTIDTDDLAAVARVLQSDWLTSGPEIDAFEQAFARKVGAKYAIACSSGTAGLHLAVLALNLGPGDKVIVPTLTFLATANAVRYAGADVVFCDVDADTGLITLETLTQAYAAAGEDVAAIFPVHLNGQCADMAAISDFARHHHLAVVEDACHAIGGTLQTADGTVTAVGSCAQSDMNVFSLHPVKTITMGEGGVITTNREDLYEKMISRRSHGMVRTPEKLRNVAQATSSDGTPNPWYYEMHELGYNYRASALHCALGASQLNKLDAFVTHRQHLVDVYDDLLRPLHPIVRPAGRVRNGQPGWHLYVVLIDFAAAKMDRARVMSTLLAAGIGTQVHYLPVHRQPYYENLYGTKPLNGADEYYARCLSLPLFPDMNDDDVSRVVQALQTILPANAEPV